ncbi:MAG: hypothetical protein U0105_25105 [Candidatus Obscuribacterales bacterium]
MRNAKHLLSLAVAALIAAPLAPATALADNDYAPTLTPTAEPTPPPVDVTGAGGNPLMQGRGAMRGGGQGGFQGGGRRMKGGGGKRGGAGRQRMMARFDTNGDGVLDDNEKQALRQFRAAHGKGGGGGGASSNAPTVGNHYNGFPGTSAGISNGLGGAPGGAGGVGGANLARGGGGGNGGGMNKEARRQKLIQRFDTNGDGKLDGNEQAAADAFRAQRRQQKMMKMQQGAAAGPGVTP